MRDLASGAQCCCGPSQVLAVQGVLNAISAGILVYNGLVDLMIPAFNVRPAPASPHAAAECRPQCVGRLLLHLQRCDAVACAASGCARPVDSGALYDVYPCISQERPGGKERSAALKTVGYISLLLGCASMCVVAKWA
jgi:hypothetical protein